MAIYAYGNPDPEERYGNRQFVYKSLVNDKISRFLWSWFDNCDLNRLKNVPLDRMSSDERKSWKHGWQLLSFRPGDWILHKNVPQWGQVTAARLSSEYFYQAEMPAQHQDGRQCFRVDKVLTFKNDYAEQGLHKVLYNEIAGRRGALYQVTCDREFYETLIALKVKLIDGTEFKLDNVDRKKIEAFGGISKKVFDSRWKNHFRREFFELLEKKHLLKDVMNVIRNYSQHDDYNRNRAFYDLFERNGILGDLTTVIQRSHPRKILEGFVAKVLRKEMFLLKEKRKDIPHVTVFENGSGWKSDFGADLIVGYSIEGTSSLQAVLVVQVKSYIGEVTDTTCVDQLETAIKHYRSNGGFIITTGYSTPILEAAIAKLEDNMNTDITLIAGDDFAGWVLKNTGLDLLF